MYVPQPFRLNDVLLPQVSLCLALSSVSHVGVAAMAVASIIMDDVGLLYKAASNFLDVVELSPACPHHGGRQTQFYARAWCCRAHDGKYIC